MRENSLSRYVATSKQSRMLRIFQIRSVLVRPNLDLPGVDQPPRNKVGTSLSRIRMFDGRDSLLRARMALTLFADVSWLDGKA